MPDETQDLFSAIEQPEGESAPIPEPTPEPAPAPAPAESAAAIAPPPSPAVAAASPPPTPEPAAAPERTVPLAVLLEERRKYEERLAAIEARQAPVPAKPAEATPAPDWIEDPKAYVDAKADSITAAIKKLEEIGAPRLEQVERASQDMALDRAIITAQEQFVAKTPDFHAALDYARDQRVAFLSAMNPGVDIPRIQQAVTMEERALSVACLQQGINPVEHVYGLAKAMGYTPKQAAAAAAALSAPAASGSGAVVPPDVTLNSTPGQAPADAGDAEEPDMLAAAQAERFTRRRA